MPSRLWKLLVCVGVPIVLLLLPVPAGLSPNAWRLFALYMAAILGLVLRPFPEPVVLLAVIGVASISFGNLGAMLSGYASSVVWLVFSAFMISTAIVHTGLGRRIAYWLVGKMGSRTLGLGYVTALTDLLLAPVTPSNTARSGGILFPIVRSVAIGLGSPPGPQGRRVGAYLTLLLYQISLTTGYLFITAIAPNLLTVKFGTDILKIDMDWGTWAIAAAVPGLACLALAPLFVYWLYPPELKHFDNKKIAADGLAELGPMSRNEKVLSVLFVFAVLAWATGSMTGINATAVAIAFVAACLLLGVVEWDALSANKSAWSTLIWYGGIVGLADGLAKAKFFDWFAQLLSDNLNLSGYNPVLVMVALGLFALVVRYLFASMATFVTAMIPVLFTLALVADLPPYPVFFLLAFGASYGCLTTHYGGALGPVLFGDGYVDQRIWWLIGGLFALLSLLVHLVVGLPYWKMLGLW